MIILELMSFALKANFITKTGTINLVIGNFFLPRNF